MAQADGDLDIDQPAKRYIEEWRGTKSRAVTIRDILSNVSGRYWDVGSDYGNLPQAEDRTQYAVDLKQQYPPGRVWAYNNAAIQTLDRVISTATGRAHPRVRRRAAVRPDRHDPHPDDGRPGRQHQRLLRDADDVPRTSPASATCSCARAGGVTSRSCRGRG